MNSARVLPKLTRVMTQRRRSVGVSRVSHQSVSLVALFVRILRPSTLFVLQVADSGVPESGDRADDPEPRVTTRPKTVFRAFPKEVSWPPRGAHRRHPLESFGHGLQPGRSGLSVSECISGCVECIRRVGRPGGPNLYPPDKWQVRRVTWAFTFLSDADGQLALVQPGGKSGLDESFGGEINANADAEETQHEPMGSDWRIRRTRIHHASIRMLLLSSLLL